MPKKITILSLSFLILAAVFTVSCAKKESSSGPITISPAKPTAGQELTVTYTPEATPLATAENIQMLAYAYSKGYPTVHPAAMEKQGNNWTASITPGPDVAGIALKFQAGEEIDNNEGKGYFVPLYGSDGNINPASTACQAEAYAGWGSSLMQLELDRPRAIELFNQAFSANPELKKDFFYTYVRSLTTEKPEGWESMANEVADEIAAQNDLDEDTLDSLITAYRTLQNQEKTDALTEKARQLYPKGYQAQLVDYQKFREEKDPDKQKAIFESFKTDFPDSNIIGTMAYLLTSAYARADRISDLKAFLEENIELGNVTMFSSAASQLMTKGVELDLATDLIGRAIEATEKQLSDPESCPASLTAKEWENRIKGSTLPSYLFILAQIQEKQEKPAEALETMEKTLQMASTSRPERNEAYVRLLLAQRQPQKAFDTASEAFKEGNSTAAMKDMLKSSYAEVKGTEEGFDAYFSELEDAVFAKMREALAKEMIDMPAPEFSLEDLEGNIVTLSGLRGKTLVLDFWATWCGPCVRAFPSMKKAQEMFMNDPDVHFLFINTWQDEEDKKVIAQDFITKNDYPFHVLMDVEDRVVAAYKVQGIPTKFVVDKEGRIRFKKIGFLAGTDEKAIKEISLMIEMVK